ncbi:hypothetical protein GCM10028816_41220 [Spirosoma lituiforme]
MLVKRIKKLFKLVGLVCLVMLALCGIGINGAGPVLSQSRERYIDNGIKTELVQTKDEEGDSVEEDEAKF